MVYALGMLRIYAGLYKGRKLKSVSDEDVRPTAAKVKLSFFDILQEDIREKIFLDGFAGTGNIGIEALSRGAEYVIFVEKLPEAVKLLRDNLERIGVPGGRYRIVQGEFNRAVIRLAGEEMRFDIIFLDPPYDLLTYANPLKVVHKRGILRPDGFIVLERPCSLPFDGRYFDNFRTQEIGRKCLDFFRAAPAD